MHVTRNRLDCSSEYMMTAHRNLREIQEELRAFVRDRDWEQYHSPAESGHGGKRRGERTFRTVFMVLG